jgi:hypothetical protein
MEISSPPMLDKQKTREKNNRVLYKFPSSTHGMLLSIAYTLIHQ